MCQKNYESQKFFVPSTPFFSFKNKIKKAIREGASPFHVPKFIYETPEIPRTRSGKIVELAIRDVINGKAPENLEALANADALKFFEIFGQNKRRNS